MEVVTILAKTISSLKIMRKSFEPMSNCMEQAKFLMYKETMKETDRLLSSGKLTQYSIETKEGIN